MINQIQSTNVEASAITLHLYDIITNSINAYPDIEEQTKHIISRIPEIKVTLDSIISNHCGSK